MNAGQSGGTSSATVPAIPESGVFAELAGQGPAVEQLHGAVSSGQPSHAWLITGPPGSGRSNAARAFAAALNCQHQQGCGQCRSCQLVRSGGHPAVTMVSTDNVSYRIDDVRDLISTAQDKPQGARWRVIVIEDADRMTERATNVLLKAIEEPPPHTVWVLCAPSPADVLVTIRSRCRHVSLRIPPTDAVTDILVARDGLDPELAAFAARVSQNHIGVARHLATSQEARSRREQAVSLPFRVRSASEAVLAAAELVKIASDDADAMTQRRLAQDQASLRRSLGLEADEKIPPKLRTQFKRLEEESTRRAKRMVADALDRTLIDFLAVYRDVLSLKLGTSAELINAHVRADVEQLADKLSPEQALGCLDALKTARTRITQNVPPQLAMEALMMALIPRTRRG